jgi:hypothetical protein
MMLGSKSDRQFLALANLNQMKNVTDIRISDSVITLPTTAL